MELPTISQHIDSVPGRCGGRPCIAGTRIRVLDIYVWHELRGRSPDEIVELYPSITLADVHAALTYYFDHMTEIQAEVASEREFYEGERLRAHPNCAICDQEATMATIRFHLDENVALAIATGLRRRGIDITTHDEEGLGGASDEDHLAFALREGRVSFTHDHHFPMLHASGIKHAGIAYCVQEKYSIGEIIQALMLLHDCVSAEEMRGRIEFL